ncbi:MAG TPA: chitobiase/beta-hexosaminidase C-terminal domain-containing protein, partial [Cytophagaceae bacterium]
MGNTPNKNWATSKASTPFSFSNKSFCSPPYSNVASGRYDKNVDVTLSSRTDGSYITYTLDGNEPTPASKKYISPILISKNTTLKAKTFHETKAPSEMLTLNFN